MDDMQAPVAVQSAQAATVRVNGVVIEEAAIAGERAYYEGEPDADSAARRALVIRELLRQRAVAIGLLDEQALFDDAAYDALLAQELKVPQPTRADCERYYVQHLPRFRRNDIVYASHILFAVTEHAPLARVRLKGEETLRQVLEAPQTFEAAARELSNCPSGAVGGSLGQLSRGDSVPEFERTLFDTNAPGILPRLVNTRFGFHVVRIDRRVEGETLPLDAVEADIARFLDMRVRHKAMQQYVMVLAGRARIEGFVLVGASGPLVQ